MNLKAVLFDMDGLLLDTERLQMDCWKKTVEAHNLDFDPNIMLKAIGGSNGEFTRFIREQYGEDFSLKDFFHKKNVILDDHIQKHGVPVKKGALELLDFLDENNIKKYIVTSTYEERAHIFLNSASIIHRFEKIITGSPDTPSKPDPYLYNRCIEVSGLHKENCIALEDSINGITACHAAKLNVIGVPDFLDLSQVRSPYLIGIKNDLLEIMYWLEDEIKMVS